jgi:hypothetical protein
MNSKEWEQTVRTIVDDSHQQPKEAGKHRVLTEWRAKLEREPTFLSPHKIDEIVREVRLRLEAKSDHR